jgi:hypothetical protein
VGKNVKERIILAGFWLAKHQNPAKTKHTEYQ